MRLTALVLLTASFATTDALGKVGPAPVSASSAPGACAVVEDARAAMLSGEALAPDAANALYGAIARGAACPGVRELPFDSCEGNATGVVASALFASGVDAAPIVRAALSDERCARQILPAAQQASLPSVELRDVLRDAAMANDANVSEAGWLALGTIASVARSRGDDALAGSIDDALAAALAIAPTVTAIEAAGNAGCAACAPALVAAMREGDPWVRRTAAGALRFVPESARAMCGSLERDANSTVREHAAWALGFSSQERSIRKACLAAAAASDENAEVRASAGRSLAAVLSEPGTDSEFSEKE